MYYHLVYETGNKGYLLMTLDLRNVVSGLLYNIYEMATILHALGREYDVSTALGTPEKVYDISSHRTFLVPEHEYVTSIGIYKIRGNSFLYLLECKSKEFIPEKLKRAEREDEKCEGQLTWTISDDNVLTISGKGNMSNYDYCFINDVPSPWYPHSSSITSIIIEEGVTSIGDCAFLECTALTTVSIPNSVISIGRQAFSGCKNLSSIIIPESVISIEEEAFWGCSKLISVTIPKNVRNIECDVFSCCSNLISIAVDNDNPFYCSENGALFHKLQTRLAQYPIGRR